MSIEEKLLKLMEAKKDTDDKRAQAAQTVADKDNDADDKTADRVDQEPAVTIENPIDPDLKSSESAQMDPDGDPDEQDQDDGIKEAFEDIKKGAFHKWLGKPEDEKITSADIKKGLASDDTHVNKMAQFAKNAKQFIHESYLAEASFFIDGTDAAKDTIDHGDWTIHHLTKPGHSGASIVARHKDGKTPSINLYTGNRAGADHMFNHPTHLKNALDSACGVMRESAEIQDFVKDEELSEEFQLKVSTLFEAKVTEKVNTLVEEKVSQIEDEYRTKLDESMQAYDTELTDKIDGYFGKLSEQWMKDNELVLEASIRSDLTESFMNGMKQLFESHYIDLPVEKFDIVTSLEEQLKASKDELSAAKQLLEEQRSQLNVAERKIILENATKGMTDIDSGKFRAIMEDFDFENSELYTKRAEIIKESFFGQNKKDSTNLSGKKLDISSKPLIEEKQIETKVEINSPVKQYAEYMRQTSGTKK